MKQTLRLRGGLCPENKPFIHPFYRIFIILTIVLVSCVCSIAQVPTSSPEAGPAAGAAQYISGTVLSAANDEPLQGATVKLKHTNIITLTDENGDFSLQTNRREGLLEISFLGFVTQEVPFSGTDQKLAISLEPDEGVLDEVVVSTGYQEIPKERATGSFFLIDSATFNRNNSTSILERLEANTSGLLVNHNKSQNTQSDLIIRGRSTILGDDKPLVVVDNFPYEGDIGTLNPNDVESISILKDASAASIWGTRAGNGVIVITTKKGRYATKPKVSIDASLTIGQKPDLFEAPWFESGQWLGLEQFLYSMGAYRTAISNGYGLISPAVEIMDQAKRGLISSSDSLERINALSPHDVRNDMARHLYRSTFRQQYLANIVGGGQNNNYYFSVGYDRNLGREKTDSYGRFTLTAKNSYNFFRDKLKVSADLFLSSTNNTSGAGSYVPFSPYERLIDDNGYPLSTSDGTLRASYLDSAGAGYLLDWHYRPLEESKGNIHNGLTAYRINTGIVYKIAKGLKATLMYQYQKNATAKKTIYGADSYFVRNQVNRLSSIDYNTGEVVRPIPIGAIVDLAHSQYTSNYGRMQMNYEALFGRDHSLSVMAGFEVRDDNAESDSHRLYGYNEDTGINRNSVINFNEEYPLYYRSRSTARVATNISNGFTADRYVSYYSNASYTYKNRYTLSASARKDESNLFGVKPNQKGVPLWSAGVLWDVSKEGFYNIYWLPELRFRASFGYSGNVSKGISSYLTANAVNNISPWGLPYNVIVNPPNPSLGWEIVKIINTGIDFKSRNGRLSGSVEPYWKYGIDLFGRVPLAPQIGVDAYTNNSANTFTKGLDVTLHSRNLIGGFRWDSDFLFSVNHDEITDYKESAGSNFSVITKGYANPVVGNPYYSVYGFKWSGLDETGSPTAYFNNEKSTEYAQIKNSLDRGDMAYIGSSVPVTHGSLRNTFTWHAIELSFTIGYRLGYYFRRSSLNNGALYSISGFRNSTDYENRWMVRGDERLTNVPALIYPSNTNRNDIYTYADILVEEADNVKLRDIRCSWNLAHTGIPFMRDLANAQIFMFLNNVGYLWRANGAGLDPDNPMPSITSVSAPFTVSFGFKASL